MELYIYAILVIVAMISIIASYVLANSHAVESVFLAAFAMIVFVILAVNSWDLYSTVSSPTQINATVNAAGNITTWNYTYGTNRIAFMDVYYLGYLWWIAFFVHLIYVFYLVFMKIWNPQEALKE